MPMLPRCRTALFLASLVALVVPFAGRAQQTDPAPQVDRVGFPEGYETYYTKLFTFDRPDNGQIRVVYGNKAASLVAPGGDFPYGSVLVMETHRARRDGAGLPVRDAAGRYERDGLLAIFVMRKERGFGTEYGRNRTGEWEYVAYRPDRAYNTAPSASAPCAICHLQARGGRDWVFRANLFSNKGSGALPDSIMHHYLFSPSTLRVRVGQPLNWYNYDEVQHRIAIDGTEFLSSVLETGGSYGLVFNAPGEYNYRCMISPGDAGESDRGAMTPSRLARVALLLAVSSTWVPAVEAQQEDRVLVGVDFTGSMVWPSAEQAVSFDLNAERGDFRAPHSPATTPGVMVHADATPWRRMTLGGAVSYESGGVEAAIDARLPHPFFFNQPRSVAGSVNGMTQNALGLAIRVGWRIPIRRRLDLHMTGGPVVAATRVSGRDRRPLC
ncbi:MAG: hypothetical protein FJW27_09455 [Acidimicrobiia bacterium]|nr:hypothetical protein [Acidimicrobiia bacterium]